MRAASLPNSSGLAQLCCSCIVPDTGPVRSIESIFESSLGVYHQRNFRSTLRTRSQEAIAWLAVRPPANPRLWAKSCPSKLDHHVAISPFTLQKSDCRYHRRNNQHVGYSVRQHVSYDCFWIFGEAVMLDQLPYLLL
jgi:hypothetical protein